MKGTVMIDRILSFTLLSTIALFIGTSIPAHGEEKTMEKTATAIREEALRPNGDAAGHVLPLFSLWCPGTRVYPEIAHRNPSRQLEWIERGHYVLPTFPFPSSKSSSIPFSEEEGKEQEQQAFAEDFLEPYRKTAELRLPFVLIGTQWENLLSKPPYLNLPEKDNPNVISPDGSVQKRVCPFGPVKPWSDVGRLWTDNSRMKQLQEIYPEPPLVVMLSNNEHGKQWWWELEKNKRYLQRYGRDKDDDFKRKIVGDGWIDRYRELQKGMREGLSNQHWRDNTIFVGYGGDGAVCMGRWGGWTHYSLHTKDRVSPWPLAWDGCSPSYYQSNWSFSTDYTVFSPQTEFMSAVFQHAEELRLNPKFWFELSVWDGYDGPRQEKNLQAKGQMSKRAYYLAQNQTFSPDRYAGYVRFGMWLVRPRVVREYHWLVPAEDNQPFLDALMEAVDEVHDVPLLREFWRKGRLVPNRAHEHPFTVDIPEQYKYRDRWFLLDADCNPQEYPLDMFWRIPVWSLALVQGEAPGRQWLVFAQSPLHETKEANVTIPDYEPVKIMATVGGAFFLVDEKTGAISSLPTKNTDVEPAAAVQ
jgi:hypothetical protein